MTPLGSGLFAALTLLAVPVAHAASADPALPGEGGLFAGLDVMDLAIIFCLSVVAFWVFSRLRTYQRRGPDDTTKKRARDAWQYLRDADPSGAAPAARQAGEGAAAGPAEGVEGFDEADFMNGARLLYGKLQTAWAARSIEAVRPFVGADLLASYEEEAARNPAPREVAVVLVEGTFAGLKKRGADECAEVRFKALLREGGAAPVEARELWRFTRGPETGGMWRLDGVEPEGTA